MLWYAFGGGESYLWFGNAEVAAGSGRYRSTSEGILADLFPVTGDFNGDGFADILFFNPSGGSPVSYGNADVATGSGQFATSTENPVGNFRPRSGDFDGDGFDDILWYDPAGAGSYIWFGNAEVAGGSGRYRSASESTVADLDPVTGDFNGDGFSDVFFFNPSGASAAWYGTTDVATGSGKFATSTESPIGNFRPRSGDLDGDGFDDILWYDPAGRSSFIWFGNAEVAGGSGRYRSTSESTLPGHVPFTGDFNGDGFSDVFFFNPSGASGVWYGNAAVATGSGEFDTNTENPVGAFSPLN